MRVEAFCVPYISRERQTNWQRNSIRSLIMATGMNEICMFYAIFSSLHMLESVLLSNNKNVFRQPN